MEYLIRGIARAGGVEVPPHATIVARPPSPPRQRNGRLLRSGARLLRGLGLQLVAISETLAHSEQALRAGRCQT